MGKTLSSKPSSKSGLKVADEPLTLSQSRRGVAHREEMDHWTER
jgi:hypothetical protein